MSVDLQPTLTGALVALRPLRPEDFDVLYAVGSDPLLWEQHPVRNRNEDKVFRAFFEESLASGGALLATDRATGQVIGSSRYHAYDAAKREVEIGWSFLARTHWGGRYNADMKRIMLAHAFQFVERVVFLIGVTNFRSQRALEKIGGVRVGTKPDAGGRDSFIYEMTPAAFTRWQTGAKEDP